MGRFWNRVYWILLVSPITCGLEDLNLPESHLSFYLRNHPEVAQRCQQDESCPYKVQILDKDLFTVYREIFAAVLFSLLLPSLWAENLKLGEFQCLKLFLFKLNCVWANSIQGETACKV